MSNSLNFAHPQRPCPQMSRKSPLEGRGRHPAQVRRAHVGPDRGDFLRRWSALLIAEFTTSEGCAVHFGVTSQAAWNWREALACPLGHHVDYARATLPRFAEIMGGQG